MSRVKSQNISKCKLQIYVIKIKEWEHFHKMQLAHACNTDWRRIFMQIIADEKSEITQYIKMQVANIHNTKLQIQKREHITQMHAAAICNEMQIASTKKRIYYRNASYRYM